MNSDISIVIPTLDCCNDLKILINSLENQSLVPAEIIISDSSKNLKIKDLIQSYKDSMKQIQES